MRIAYFDCFSGASGDMILGSLIDAGLSPRLFREVLKKLGIPDVHLRIKKVLRGGISATQVIVGSRKNERPHRDLKELLRIVQRSSLETHIKKKSKEIFERIALAEAKIHQKPVDEIHFHELGGLDSVVDIVGSVWGLDQLHIDQIHVSKVNVGTGFVQCEHGLLPVPAPATLYLMQGKPIYSSGVERELLTPTGAAILTSVSLEFGPMPFMEVERIGYGAGRDELSHPNVLRLIVGTSVSHPGEETVLVIETNIDDMNPQFYDFVMEGLFAMGTKDVFLTPIIMKKNRPASLLTIVTSPEKLSSITDFLLKETTTIGLRWREETRARADREILSLRTKYGKIRFKLARWDGKIINVSPEYEDCKRLALEKRVSLKEVFEEAKKKAIVSLKS